MDLYKSRKLNELEKLKIANQIANDLLQSRIGSNTPSEGGNEANYFDERLSKPSSMDLWGADDILEKDQRLNFAKKFLQSTTKNLKRNHCLKTVARKSSYEEVEDISFLTNNDERSDEWVIPMTQRSETTQLYSQKNIIFPLSDSDIRPTKSSNVPMVAFKDHFPKHILDKEESERATNSSFSTRSEESECSNDGKRLFDILLQSTTNDEDESDLFVNKTAEQGSNIKEEKETRSVSDLSMSSSESLKDFDNMKLKHKYNDNKTEDNFEITEGHVRKLFERVNVSDKKIKQIKSMRTSKASKCKSKMLVDEKTQPESVTPLLEQLFNDPSKNNAFRGLRGDVKKTIKENESKSHTRNEPATRPRSAPAKTSQIINRKITSMRKTSTSRNVKQQEKFNINNGIPKLKLDKMFSPRPILPQINISQNTLNGFEWCSLPDEIILNIFSFLNRSDLFTVMEVNCQFQRIANDSTLWKTIKFRDKVITPDVLSCLNGKTPTAVMLEKCKYKNITNQNLRIFFTLCKKKLKSIFVTQCQIPLLSGDNILLHVSSHCNQLEELSVPWSNTTDNGLSAISDGSDRLKKVDISGNASVTDQSFVRFITKHAKSLQELKINGCFAIKPASLCSISNCHLLTVLDAGLLTKLDTNQIIELCKNLKALKILNLRGIKGVTDACLHSIAIQCSELKELIISKCESITDNGVKEIATYLLNLEKLDVSGCCYISDDGVTSLVMNNMQHLKHLNISSTSVSHFSVNCITENCYNSLEELRLNFCQNISKKCIERLINFCFMLRHLQLFGCKRIDVGSMSFNNQHLKIES